MYKLTKNSGGQIDGAINLETFGQFSFNADNTDYAQFKKAISEETAQLQDAEGTLMTAQAAKDFIKELP
jgi:hypothetical protein